MAGGINVGSVLVDVLPDARGWDEKLSAQITPAAEAVGKKISRDLEDDIADGARKGAERAKIDLATIGDVNVNVDVDNTAALGKLAEVNAAAKEAQRSAADSANGMSPLIVAAVAGGLIAGGPLLIAAAGVAAAGAAAVFLHNQQDVAASANQMAADVKAAYSGVADAAIPELTVALGKLRTAAIGMAPQMRDLFTAVGPAIQGVTDGIIGLAQGVMPGLIAAVKSGAPVFDGLKHFLTDIGTGLGDMFQILSEHTGAFGQVFTSLGDILHTVLPALGDLLAAGGELGAVILPPLAAVLGVIGDVLHAIAPILPEIVLGFAGFKVISTVTPLLDSLAQKLAFASYSSGPLAGAAGAASSAVSNLGAVLPAVGVVVGLLGTSFMQNKQQVDSWAQAMLKGGAAAREASAEMATQDAQVHSATSGWRGFVTSMTPASVALNNMANDTGKTRQAYSDLLKQMDPLTRAQTLATAAQNDLSDALSRGDAHGAAVAMSAYNAQTAEAKRQQELLNVALNHSSIAEEDNKTRLQGLANAASAGNSQINLLKGALDALTGKAVSLGDAEVGVTNAVDAATTALKGKKGALVDATGAVNLHTEAGAALWQSMTAIAGADNTLIATMEKHGAKTEDVIAKDAELRGQFVQTAKQMGLTADQANNMADQIYGIPEKRNSEITLDTAAAMAAAKAADDWLNWVARNRTATIVLKTIGGQGNMAGASTAERNAVYGEIGGVVHAYASGGMEPMQGGIAQIVAPQTYRIIGDRVTDDEAYIPINNSLRSLQILAQTASRMNFNLAPAGSHGGATPKSSGHTPALQIGQYYEAGGSSARETAEELAWMARTRG